MLLFVGLGNPGEKYARNRHNVGFMAVDAIAKRHGFPPWRRRFQGVATEGPLGGERVQLLLPGTFMNESGRAVAEAMHFYKLALVRRRRVPGRARTAAGQGAGEDRRRHRRAQRPALDHARMSATTTAGCGSASAIPASRRWCILTCSATFAKSERGWVEALTRHHRGQCGAPGARPGRELPEQGASRHGRQGLRSSPTTRRRTDKKTSKRTSWASNAASSACPMSASRRSSMR